MWSLTRAHSRRRPALVATTFLNSRGGRLRDLTRASTVLCQLVYLLQAVLRQAYSYWDQS